MKNKLLLAFATLLLVLIGAVLKPMKVKAQTLDTTLNNINYFHSSYYYMFWSDEPGVLDTYLPGSTTETYNPSTRRWHGMPYITRTDEGRLWVSYGVGGYLEPDNLNYAVLQYSDDDGLTWSEEFLIIERDKADDHLYPPIVFFNEGKLFLYLGSYMCILDNPDCENPSKNLHFPTTFYYTGVAPCHAPTKLNDRFYIWTCEPGTVKTNNRIIASANAMVWEEIAINYSAGGTGKRWHEGQICVLSDGRLMMLSRVDGGSGVERAYSDDDGYTWSNSETDLPSPLCGPKTKLCIINTNDGGLLLINNDSTACRENMTAWLSYDDGETWPYKLILDDRHDFDLGFWGMSYPDATSDKDGNIYIVWDQRTPVSEIAMAKITTDDVKAGHIVTNGSFTFKTVYRVSEYTDVKSVDEEYRNFYLVDKGTSLDSIISELPTTINYTDSKGTKGTLTGTWSSDDYKGNEGGLYTIEFKSSSKPSSLLDPLAILKVRVKVNAPVEPSGNEGDNNTTKTEVNGKTGSEPINFGCNGSILPVIASVALIPFALITFKKRRRYS